MSKLAAIKKEKLSDPLRYLFYGQEGVGKSTLAAHAPSPIWFDCEDGTGRLSVARYPFREGRGGHVPATLQDVRDAIRDLETTPHDYKTLVIDTADKLESLAIDHVLERESKSGKKLNSVTDLAYGRGWDLVHTEWRNIVSDLEHLRKNVGMSVVILSHAQIKIFKNPEGEDYDRWSLRVHTATAGLLKAQSDVVGFCVHEDGVADVNKRARGFSTGRRLVKFGRTAAFDAKTRLELPAEVELVHDDPWAPIAAAVKESIDTPRADLIKLIVAECARIGGKELQAKVLASCEKAKEITTLNKYLNDLRLRQPKESTDATTA